MNRRLAILVVLLIGAVVNGRTEQWRALVQEFCLDCHDASVAEGDLDLERHLSTPAGEALGVWEAVLKRIRAGQMPPPGKRRPDAEGYRAVITGLEGELDEHARQHPDPGRSATFRRLTRLEYRNAIRELLGIEVDVRALLPPDSESHGFDNVTVGDLSPTLLNRYLSAAQKISRQALGRVDGPEGRSYRVRPDLTQDRHLAGLPLGTRGGTLIRHEFPQDGEYELLVRLMRDRNEHVEGLNREHELDVLLDGRQVKRFVVKPARNGLRHEDVDRHLKVRFHAQAGPREVGVTFVKLPESLEETRRQPYQAHYNFHRHPRLGPAVFQVTLNGPFGKGTAGDTPGRRRILTRRPTGPGDEDDCAREILTGLARRAFRRPVSVEDLAQPMALYREAKAEGGFEAGLELGLSALLVSPNFLMRIERDPDGMAPGEVYRVSDLALASRLSFFLWSGPPDEELLAAAESGELSRSESLARQVRRLLADPRAKALAENFAGQWLHLRNLDATTPDLRLFPDFDDNLRRAFRRETELLFEDVVMSDRPITGLLSADHTFLNERLARHYGIPHVHGSRFRRVELPEGSRRGGLLRHGSILTVTSYANRTSPVLRGNWVLENILGTPAPPPPPNVPALDQQTIDATLPIRERLARHREDHACAACHRLIDPVGFGLERYDAIGRWRAFEEGVAVDADGGLPDGSVFNGVAELETALLRRPGLFAGVLAEKLMTYALGRGVGPADAAAVRQVVRHAARNEFRFSALVSGIVHSPPFLMRKAR